MSEVHSVSGLNERRVPSGRGIMSEVRERRVPSERGGGELVRVPARGPPRTARPGESSRGGLPSGDVAGEGVGQVAWAEECGGGELATGRLL